MHPIQSHKGVLGFILVDAPWVTCPRHKLYASLDCCPFALSGRNMNLVQDGEHGAVGFAGSSGRTDENVLSCT